jgi:hypothetical protein
MTLGWQLTIAGALAGSVGLAEIVARYRSDPGFALQRLTAWSYILLNVAAGVGALFIVRAFGWTFGQTGNVDLWRSLVAGFGALAVFRSSLFVTKVGETEVNVGPNQVLTSLLDTFDRAIDRACAAKLVDGISEVELEKLDPTRVMSTLPVLCLSLMQNFSAADQTRLAGELGKIQKNDLLKPREQMQATIVQLAKFLGNDLVGKVLTASASILVEPTPVEKVIEEARAISPKPAAA